MDTDTLTIKPKSWAKNLFIFVLSPFLIVIPGYFLFNLFSTGSINDLVVAQIFLVITFSICFLVGIYGLIVFSRAEITFENEQIIAQHLTNKVVPYHTIKSVTINNGGLIVSDGTLKNRVSVDFLYEDIDQAISHLAQKISNPEQISFKGDKELIRDHFGVDI